MDLQQIRDYAKQCKDLKPKLSDEINDLLQLMKDNIEDGESMQNEIEICYSDIKELMKK